MGVSAHHTLGQRPVVLLQAFTSCIPAVGVRKRSTSSYYPNGNGGVERVNHTMAQMLVMIVNKQQDDGDLHLPHVEFPFNNSVSAATGSAPNEVHTMVDYHVPLI